LSQEYLGISARCSGLPGIKESIEEVMTSVEVEKG
jgi:hypothetical protein